MKIHQLTPEDALASVRSAQAGLSDTEALRRLHEYGPNSVQKIARSPLWLRLFQEFTHFFSIILWVASGLAFVAEWNDPGQGMARIGYALIGVIVVSGIFSFWQEYRIEQTLKALQNLLPRQIQTLRAGTVVNLLIDQLVPGDVVLLEQGNIVPADCRIIDCKGMRVNNATVTGESRPKAREEAASGEEDLLQSKNILLAGTSLVSGIGRAVVYATGEHTEFGKIARLTQTAGEVTSPLRKELAHLSRMIALFAVIIGLVFFAISAFLKVPFWQDFIFSIGIIVAMVPEGLLPTLTLALVLAAQRMARRNVLIRHLPSVETLGSTTVICTDKTGTLTENRMRAKEALLGLDLYRVDDVKSHPDIVAQNEQLWLGASLCHDLKEIQDNGTRCLVGDPMEVALVEMSRTAFAHAQQPERLAEVPFDSDRMRQSVMYDMDGQCLIYCKGALESVLPLCKHVLHSGEAHPLDSTTEKKILLAQEAMAERGLRILAFAFRRAPSPCVTDEMETDLTFCGLVGLEDPPRPEVKDAIRKCSEARIRVIMVTGDHPRTATAIAREIGLIQSEHPTVLSGEQLRRLSRTELQLALDAPEILFARVAADQKMRIVEALKKKRHTVAVTGDGVNDAPALKAAHIGIAMGRSGTDVAKEAADMVLLDDNFASIVTAIEEGRAVFQNIRKFLTYVLVHNVAELIPYLAFIVFRIPLPLTPIQALSVDMGTDSLTALGLGIERPDSHVMEHPPRSRKTRLLNLALAMRAYLFLGLIEAGAAMAAFFYTLHEGGWQYGQTLTLNDPLYLQATTATLSTIIVMQIVNVFLCRSAVRSVFSTGFFNNPLINWGIVLEIVLILIIDYTPWANALIGTAPIPARVWLFVIPFAVFMLIMEEGRKWIVRRRLARASPPPSPAPKA